MKERPILMCSDMVRAILAGQKTQTRRVVKRQLSNPKPTMDDGIWSDTKDPVTRYFACPYGMVNDHLWIKETFHECSIDTKKKHWEYRADFAVDNDIERDFVWKPSIFMPREASRITLEITNVRVERVQAITETDAIAEGWPRHRELYPNVNTKYKVLQWYQRLWNTINAHRNGGIYAWEKNPFCWVISFNRLLDNG